MPQKQDKSVLPPEVLDIAPRQDLNHQLCCKNIRFPGIKRSYRCWYCINNGNWFGCGGRTWTYGLRVMSPTSYQLLHPAISIWNCWWIYWWRELDSNQRRRSRQIYSLLPLATRESLHIKINLKQKKIGAGDRNWTHNLLITSQLLYRLSYTSAFLDKNYYISFEILCQHFFYNFSVEN